MEKQLTVEIAELLLKTLREDFKLDENDVLPKEIISESEAQFRCLDFGLCYLARKRFQIEISSDIYISRYCGEVSGYIFPWNPFNRPFKRNKYSFNEQLQEFLNVRIKILESFIEVGGYKGLGYPEIIFI